MGKVRGQIRKCCSRVCMRSKAAALRCYMHAQCAVQPACVSALYCCLPPPQLLYERTVGSGVGVLTNLVDGMCRWVAPVG